LHPAPFMSSSRERQSPSPAGADGLSRRFKALDLSHPKQKISKWLGNPPSLGRWAGISQHDPYLKKPKPQDQSSSDKPLLTAPQGSSQAPSVQLVHQPPPHPPNPNRPSTPPALIQMPEPSVNHALNYTRPAYDQPPHPGGFMAPGVYLVVPAQAPYSSTPSAPYPSGERLLTRVFSN
jgi:hypothetical protein